MDRPDKLNAQNPTLITELDTAFATARADGLRGPALQCSVHQPEELPDLATGGRGRRTANSEELPCGEASRQQPSRRHTGVREGAGLEGIGECLPVSGRAGSILDLQGGEGGLSRTIGLRQGETLQMERTTTKPCPPIRNGPRRCSVSCRVTSAGEEAEI